MNFKRVIKIGKLDEEWVALVLMAKEVGFKPVEIRNFISENEKTDKGCLL